MACKFALFMAICISQGITLRPQIKISGSPIDVAEEIPQDFDEAVEEMDEVSVAAMEAYISGKDREVIVACFRAQKDNYTRVGQQVVQQLKEGSKEMAQELGDKYEKYAEKAAVPISAIGETMKNLPERMWVYVKDYEFGKALEVMRESRKTVEENSRIFYSIVSEMAQEAPEAAKRAREIAQKIRSTSRNGCIEIKKGFKRCVAEGGPQKPIEGEDASEE